MKTEVFNRQCWGTTLTTFCALLTVFILAWSTRKQPIPRPENPGYSHSFLGYYGYNSGQNSSYIYRHGLLGYGNKIRDCDLLIIGSSHTLFGLSAEQLQAKLRGQYQRPISVFNASIAGGTLSDVLEILKANDVKNKTIIIDLFSTGRKLADANPAQVDTFGAYIHVISSFLDFTKDWCLDPYLPHMSVGQKKALPKFERMLTTITYNNADYGDATLLWYSHSETVQIGHQQGRESGTIFPSSSTSMTFPIQDVSIHPDPELKDLNHDTIEDISPEFRQEIDRRNLHPIVILLPYHNFQPGKAEAIAKGAGYPFIPIASEGLATWDVHHLTSESRTIATDRLYEGMVQHGIEIFRHSEMLSLK